jgi:hypothetical protein
MGTEEASLTPLERALLEEIRGDRKAIVDALGKVETELAGLRKQAPDRTHLWALGALWILTLFLVAIVAATRGVDPNHAAQAVPTLVPLTSGAVAAEPKPAAPPTTPGS